MKRSLLALTITAVSFQMAHAAPFMPMDARGLAMGNTGVASAKRAHAPAYNPSLLSQARDNDDFSIIFPQVGIMAGDPAEISDTALDIADEIFPKFENAIEGGFYNGTNTPGLENSVDNLQNAVNGLITAVENFDPNDPATSVSNILAAKVPFDDATDETDLALQHTQSSLVELTDSLRGISGHPLNARLGVSTAVAVPGKKLAVAVSISGSANVSAKVNFADKDFNLLNGYIPAAQGLLNLAEDISSSLDTLPSNSNVTQNEIDSLKTNIEGLRDYKYTSPEGVNIFDSGALTNEASNPDLSSTAQVVAVSVVDIGLSFAHEFDIAGEKIAIGITPKIQKISTFHYASEIDGFEDVETDDLKDSQLDYTKFNLDLGASYRFGENKNWMVGVVAKNLLGGTFDYKDINVIKDGTPTGDVLDGGSVSLKPQYRAGASFNSKWFNAAFDLDLIENKPVAFEAPTQYASLGLELDAWGWAQLRAGYRTNMAEGGVDVASIGIGLSPGDVFVIDITAMANPSDYKKEAGAVFEMGLNF